MDAVFAKLRKVVRKICLVPHPVEGVYVRIDEESGYSFWTIQCKEFNLTFTDKPDVKMANHFSVPALDLGMTWDEVADTLMAVRPNRKGNAQVFISSDHDREEE